MSSLPITEAIMIATVVQSATWTLHTVAFAFAFRYIIWDSKRMLRRNNINWLILISCCLIWILATFNFILNAVINIRAFAFSDGPGGAAAALAVQDWKGNMTTTVQLIIISIADFVMIYRCWILYSRGWLVILLPSLLQLGEMGCGLTLVVLIWRNPPETTLTYHEVAVTIRAVTIATWACTCALTVLTTFFIFLRIWSAERTTKKMISGGSLLTRGSLMHIVRIIAESGLLYAVVILITLIVFVTGSTATYILTAMDFQIAGIAFDLIIIRSATHIEREYTLSTAHIMPSFVSRIWQTRSHGGGTIGIDLRGSSTTNISSEDRDAELGAKEKDQGIHGENH